MPDTTLAFTPEAVRDALLAAGFSESEFRIVPYPRTIFVTWDHAPLRWSPEQQESIHGGYRNALRQAGFRVGVQAGCVPVNGLQEED
jgi:hypothetical protein